MAGISDKALKNQYAENKYRFNDGTELANKEFSDGSGLEMYETDFRGYDPQIGRFWQIDPIGEIFEDWSSYSYAFDNPIMFNDPLGLSAEDASTYDKKKTPKPPKTPKKPNVKTLPTVTVVGYKKDCKTCSTPTVHASPPGNPPSINFIHWPNSTNEEREEWKRDQGIYYDRLHAGAQLIQGGESQHYLESLGMYQQWTQAEQDGRIMQYGAVGLILGPAVITELAGANLGEILFNGQVEAFVEAERVYNLAARDIIYALRWGLRNRLTIDQIIRLERLAEKYKSLNKVMKSSQQIYKFYKALRDVLK